MLNTGKKGRVIAEGKKEGRRKRGERGKAGGRERKTGTSDPDLLTSKPSRGIGMPGRNFLQLPYN